MTPVFWGLVRTNPAERDWATINASAAKLGKLYGILDKVLAMHAYVAGPDLTPADMAIGVHAHRYMSFEGIEKPALPNLAAWYDRLLALPEYKTHIAIKMT
jgi:glutathione S-transferase